MSQNDLSRLPKGQAPDIPTILRYAEAHVVRLGLVDEAEARTLFRGPQGNAEASPFYQFTKRAVGEIPAILADMRKGLPAPRPAVKPNMKESKHPELRNLWVSGGLTFDPKLFSMKPDTSVFKPMKPAEVQALDDRIQKALADAAAQARPELWDASRSDYFHPNAALFIDEGIDRGYTFVLMRDFAVLLDPRPGREGQLALLAMPNRGDSDTLARVFQGGRIRWPAGMSPEIYAQQQEQEDAEQAAERAEAARKRGLKKDKDQFISDSLLYLFGSEAARDGFLAFWLSQKNYSGQPVYDRDDIWRALLFIMTREIYLGRGGSFDKPQQIVSQLIDPIYDDGGYYKSLRYNVKGLKDSPHWSVEAIRQAPFFRPLFEGDKERADALYNEFQHKMESLRKQRYAESEEGRAAAQREAKAQEAARQREIQENAAKAEAKLIFDRLMASGPNPWAALEDELRSGKHEMTLGGLAARPPERKGVIERKKGFFLVHGPHTDFKGRKKGYTISPSTYTDSPGSLYVKFLPVSRIIETFDTFLAPHQRDGLIFDALGTMLRREDTREGIDNGYRLDWPLRIYREYKELQAGRA